MLCHSQGYRFRIKGWNQNGATHCYPFFFLKSKTFFAFCSQNLRPFWVRCFNQWKKCFCQEKNLIQTTRIKITTKLHQNSLASKSVRKYWESIASKTMRKVAVLLGWWILAMKKMLDYYCTVEDRSFRAFLDTSMTAPYDHANENDNTMKIWIQTLQALQEWKFI